ncbi:hypothetical protein [Streptomyces chartreusis]|uniref:hypothetical protein n=1 Tax=Streptomyces chartreusis TaxID=1969 RepID=UPI003642269F
MVSGAGSSEDALTIIGRAAVTWISLGPRGGARAEGGRDRLRPIETNRLLKDQRHPEDRTR